MVKSKIIKDLVENPDAIITALYRLLVISESLGNEKLQNWVKSELVGYNSSDELPEYRCFMSNNICYYGYNLRIPINNQPLDISFFNKDSLKDVLSIKMKQGIESIISTLNEKGRFSKDLSSYSGEISANTDEGIQCIKIINHVDKSYVDKIITEVRTKAIIILSKIENEFGELDDIDIDTSEKDKTELDKINKNIIVIIDKSMNFGDHNKLKNCDITSQKEKIDG